MDDRELLKTVMGIVGRDRCLDDCAIIPFGDKVMVATTDMLHATTDFVGGMSDWEIGWMSAAVSLSDIASMAAAPKYMLFAVGLDRWEQLAGVMQGASDCCRKYGAEIIGGDIDRHGELTIVSTGLGIVEKQYLVRRTGARPGDLVCVTGTCGQAQAFLDGYSQHKAALFTPQPRVSEGQILGKAGVTAMMDVSDGIALSLHDLLDANSCGFSIESAKVPLPAGIPDPQARELALFGGGDYELIFTCPEEIHPIAGVRYTVIGKAIPDRRVLIDGRPLKKRGYQHRWG
ncbi:MAG: thiamine monophosphate kinase [Methanoregula sp. PtaU1.Bin051]|nr:MAG: thiamine monophosphate kinase [Methanoregula sp. PtaU1.Bin051]